MSNNSIKQELYDVLSGKIKIRNGEPLQTIACYLRASQETSVIAKSAKQFKREEAQRLKAFAVDSGFWIDRIDFENYVSEGAEQRVYLRDSKHVMKLNDSIYYESWLDYLYNLILHNYFFEDTAYQLTGFTEFGGIIYSVVLQNYVSETGSTNMKHLNHFLQLNGFENIRNNDYMHKDLGIILEDLHDENVLTNNGVLYFIDTVFYLTPAFWKTEGFRN